MTRKFAALAGELSLDDLRRLLAVKERLTELESRRSDLESELAKVGAAIADLVKGGPVAAASGTSSAKAAKKTGRRKVGRKKAVAKKVAAKKAVAKKATKKTAKKSTMKKSAKKMTAAKRIVSKKRAVTKKAAAKKPVVKKPVVKGKATGKATLESVVAGLIRANGGKMSVQDILAAIAKGKLVKSKSGNFANVLRRTLSTSTILVSAGRGLYKVK